MRACRRFRSSLGTEYYGKPAGFGEKIFNEYNDKHYHQPSDEYHDDWDFSGMEEAARFGFLIGMTVANEPQLPTWHAGDEFLPARLADKTMCRNFRDQCSSVFLSG